MTTYISDDSRLYIANIIEQNTDHIFRVALLTAEEKEFNNQKVTVGVMFLHVAKEVFHETVDNFSNKQVDPKFLEQITLTIDGVEGYIFRLETKSSGIEGPFTKRLIAKYKQHSLNGNLCYYLKVKSNGTIQYLNSKFYLIDNNFFRTTVVPLAKYSVIPAIKPKGVTEEQQQGQRSKKQEVLGGGSSKDINSNQVLLLASSTTAAKIRKEAEGKKRTTESEDERRKRTKPNESDKGKSN
jgi:hypothetical protein